MSAPQDTPTEQSHAHLVNGILHEEVAILDGVAEVHHEGCNVGALCGLSRAGGGGGRDVQRQLPTLGQSQLLVLDDDLPLELVGGGERGGVSVQWCHQKGI